MTVQKLVMQSEGASRLMTHEMEPAGTLLGTPSAWHFQWVDQGAPAQLAQVTGQLRWRGFDLAFAADGLLGVDWRLAAPGLATLPGDLQQVVLHHFADQCLQPLLRGPLVDMSLQSLQWHEDPVPMVGEFEFRAWRVGLRGASRGRLTVFGESGRRQLLNALASLCWPLPGALAEVAGRLQVGTARLTAAELGDLEEGDLVWLDDAEVAPEGLRARFLPLDGADPSCAAWIKRSAMVQTAPAVLREGDRHPHSGGNTVVTLSALSPPMVVQRSWLQGVGPAQALGQPALAMTWTLVGPGGAFCEGRLVVVARRLGLRVARVGQPVALAQETQVG